jgi:transcriptional regulator with XRE-family HTH domain
MALNPDILARARTTAGLSAGEAAERLGFRDARDRSAADRLLALEAGAEEPSRGVPLKAAKAYRRSPLVFYLQAPPRAGDRGPDFRTVPGVQPSHYDPVPDAPIRDARGRQSIVGSVLEDSEPRQPASIFTEDLAGASHRPSPPR